MPMKGFATLSRSPNIKPPYQIHHSVIPRNVSWRGSYSSADGKESKLWILSKGQLLKRTNNYLNTGEYLCLLKKRENAERNVCAQARLTMYTCTYFNKLKQTRKRMENDVGDYEYWKRFIVNAIIQKISQPKLVEFLAKINLESVLLFSVLNWVLLYNTAKSNLS